MVAARARLPMIARLIEYDRRAFVSFERGLARRGWPEAVRDRGIGHGSYKDTLVHILNVHEAWFVAIIQGRWEIFDDPARRPRNIRSWSDLRRYRSKVWRGIDEFLAHATESELRRRVRAPWMPGRYTVEDGVFQASFEQAHHLGEIIGACWRSGRAPPQMMWLPMLLGTRVSVR